MAQDKKEVLSSTKIDPLDEKQAKPPSSTSTDDAEVVFGINEKALLRKLDRKLLPALTLLYLLSFLDRSNGISNPRRRWKHY